ncbi:substrate-binding domain-containing protein [Nakamurella sp. YIM 132087]|uniref:Substrate-binding domain-containing protein n=1 Tax=Nakamurella alba TaxID=2665158 RepID=A0A7K1FLT9_9ACTN|nr:sugar ABC transporter substrate-binding protein [Nakamurella alba]MTD15127.1 substrate-binding domain-containing protein [Nakamurella alba]
MGQPGMPETMVSSTRRRRPSFGRRAQLAALTTSALLVLAACGSDSGSGTSSTTAAPTTAASTAPTSADTGSSEAPTSGSSEAPTSSNGGGGELAPFEEALAAATAAPTYDGPTEGPKPEAGKKIAVVTCAAVNTGCAATADSVKEAGDSVGWETTILDGKGSPTGASQAMISAINSGAEGIVLVAIDSSTILQGMNAAKSAGVPVVSALSDNQMGDGAGQVYAEISGQSELAGSAIADYFIVQSGGTAKVASFHIASLASTTNRYNGFIGEIGKCSGCEVVSDQTYGLVSQAEFTNLIKGTLTANPSIEYIFLDVSQYASIAATALQQMGMDNVGVAGVDCLPPEVQSIKDGTGSVACSNAAVSLAGWPTVNELTRAFAGEPAMEEKIPFRLLTKDIVDVETAPYMDGFTPADGYKQLWGVTS